MNCTCVCKLWICFIDLTSSSCRRSLRDERPIKECEWEERKQRKIDHYFKKRKKEKDCRREVIHYDGDDEEDPATEIIVNPVELAESKAIVSASNEVPSKFKETSNELSERRETSLDVRVETRREITSIESHIDVTSMTELITNAVMTLMDEIQHAVVHIIPATENIEEGNIQKEQLQEVSESVVQSTEVEYQLASAEEMSRPTVMQDVQAMEVFGKGAYTKMQ